VANLNIGVAVEGPAFTLPDDAIARTFAIIGQRGSGKSSLATVMAEELCKAYLPWIALDPVGVWWGLRAGTKGDPKAGFPVVVFGGERQDLPLEKGSGRKIAEACIAANVFAVIDLSQDSKTTWRTVVRDFCHGLQELRPEAPRHVFLEEAPEFVPQRASHQLGAECKEIVERLIRLGRNWGYGATVLTQRPATVDKDVLSQCENLFTMRTSGAHDRKALFEWMEAHQAIGLNQALAELATLPDGTAWFWSPQWLKQFVKVAMRRRETFHPGETRTVGSKARSVELVDVESFVAKVRKELTKTSAAVSAPSHLVEAAKDIRELAKNPKLKKILQQANAGVANALAGAQDAVKEHQDRIAELALENGKLRAEIEDQRRENAGLRHEAADANRRLEAVRKDLWPTYQTYMQLFMDLGEKPTSAATGEISEAWVPWLAKAATVGCRGMLEILIKRGRLQQRQLATLAGVKFKGSTWRKYRGWMTGNHLAELQGEEIEAVKL
jgi:hypothetical protein